MRLFRLIVLLFAALAFGSLCEMADAQAAESPENAVAPATRAPQLTYPTAASTPLGGRVATLLAESQAAHAHWGIAVTALDGTPLYGLEEGKLFRPASTAKLFTTAAAMSLLGPEARVLTQLTYTGELHDGTLDGFLSLRGAGDANFAGANAGSSGGDPFAVLEEFAAQVSSHGIHEVTQGVSPSGWLLDPYPRGWAIEDELFGYGAPVSAFILNDSAVQLTVTPAASAGETALVSLTPSVGSLHTLGTVYTVPATAPAGLEMHQWPGNEGLLSINGTVAIGAPVHETLAVADPAAFAAAAFAERLEARGIHVAARRPSWAYPNDPRSFAAIIHEPVVLPRDGESVSSLPFSAVPPSSDVFSPQAASATSVTSRPPRCVDACVVLATHTSGPLADDVGFTLKRSENLHAEAMLRRLGAAFGRNTTFAAGVRVLRQFLSDAGLPDGDVSFFDGSGLSTQDLVTPRAEVQLLAYAARQPWFAQWKAALPVGGVDGTLASRFTQAPLKGHVFAKTGTLGESRALAGYVLCASGRTVIFAILDDDHEPGGTADRVAMDKIVEAIAAAY